MWDDEELIFNDELDDVDELFDLADKIEIASQFDVDSNADYHAVLKREQERRAGIVTDILDNYKTQQKQRYDYKKEKKPCLVNFLLTLVILLTLLMGYICYKTFSSQINTEIVVALVASLVSYLGSVFTILTIVVKHLFPSDEDKNFNELVSSIVENDTIRIKNENDYDISRRGQKSK